MSEQKKKVKRIISLLLVFVLVFSILPFGSAGLWASETEPEHTHNYENAEWKSDDTLHWKECVDNECTDTENHGKTQEANHDFVTVDGTIKCKDCAKELSNENNEHSFEAWSTDDTKHWKECSVNDCEIVIDSGEHEWGDDNKCTICGYAKEQSESSISEKSYKFMALYNSDIINGIEISACVGDKEIKKSTEGSLIVSSSEIGQISEDIPLKVTCKIPESMQDEYSLWYYDGNDLGESSKTFSSCDELERETTNRRYVWSLSRNYVNFDPVKEDVNGPNIKAVTFNDKGKSVNPNESVTLTVSARDYDKDGEVRAVSVEFISNDNYSGWSSESCLLKSTGNTDEYTAKVPIDSYYASSDRDISIRIKSVTVYDKYGNASTKEIDISLADDFSFILKKNSSSVSEIKVENVSIKYNKTDITLTDDKLSEAIEIYVSWDGIEEFVSGLINDNGDFKNYRYPQISIRKINSTSGNRMRFDSARYDSTKKCITYTCNISPSNETGKFYVSNLSYQLYDEYFNIDIPSSKADPFKISKIFSDTTAPVIKSVAIDQEVGKTFVKDNSENLTFTVVVEDKSIEPNSDFGLHLINNNSNYQQTVQMKYDSSADNTRTFKGVLAIDSNIDIGEWYLSNFTVYDKYANRTNYSDPDRSIYFYVKTESGTVTLPTYDVNVVFMGLNWQHIQEVECKNVLDRTPIKKMLGDDFSMPTLPEDEKLGKFVGWARMRDKTLLSDNTLFFGQSSQNELYLYPVFEKVKVGINYIQKDGERKYNEEYISYEFGKTTRGELKDEVKKIIGDNHYAEITGISLSFMWNDDDVDSDILEMNDFYFLSFNYSKYPLTCHLIYLTNDNQLKNGDFKTDVLGGTWLSEIEESIQLPSDAKENSGFYYHNVQITTDYGYAEFVCKYSDMAIYDVWGHEENGDAMMGYGFGKHISGETILLPDKLQNKNVEWYFEGKKVDYNFTIPMDYNLTQYLYLKYKFINSTSTPTNPQPPVTEPSKPEIKPEEKPEEKPQTKPEEKPEEKPQTKPETKPVVPETPQQETTRPETPQQETTRPETPQQVTTRPETPQQETTRPETPQTQEEQPQTPPATENTTNIITPPGVEIEKKKVESAVLEINTAIEKAIANATTADTFEKPTVVLDMKNEDGSIATVVSPQILSTIAGNNIDVVLDMGGYSWTINGNDVDADVLSAINLEVNMGGSYVPQNLIKSLAGDQPTQQISLTHEGTFGFKASLTINLGSEYVGQFGNLYYHDSKGKLVFMNAGEINADGSVSLDFSHASDYVIVIGEEVKAEEGTTADEIIASNKDKTDDTAAQNSTKDVAEKIEAEGTNSLTIILGIIGALAVLIIIAAIILAVRKKN